MKRRYFILLKDKTKEKNSVKNKRKLTGSEKKQIAELIRKAKPDKKASSAQESIPYLSMHPDGICRVTENCYSKCISFSDINYQLAGADDKTAIFENWCDFLNYFDSSVDVQLSKGNNGLVKLKFVTFSVEAENMNAAKARLNRIETDMLNNFKIEIVGFSVLHKYLRSPIKEKYRK